MDNEKTKLTKEKKKKYDATKNAVERPTQRRIPISFSSNNLHAAASLNNDQETIDDNIFISMNRYRYYSRLGMPIMPDHVVPSKFFVLVPLISREPGTQKSYVTIFAIWNTMMGTSFLSMPWVIEQAGFALGIFLMLLVATVAFYTVYLVLKASEKMRESSKWTLLHPDFTDACKYYLGKPGEILAILFSFLGLLGALIVYYVLLSNFLYNSIDYIYNYASNHMVLHPPVILHNRTLHDVFCNDFHSYPTHNASNHNNNISLNFNFDNVSGISTIYPATSSPKNTSDTSHNFYKLWSLNKTVPFWLLIIILPLVSVRSVDFFTKFNAFGTVSIIYLLILLIFKAIKWGINVDFSAVEYPEAIPLAKVTFPVLTGVGMLAFFIHNAVHSIIRNQEKPENNIRDVFIAYICVVATYLAAGLIFYISFPFPKSCIEQNFLSNLTTQDMLAFIARIALFLQMMTVFPLLMYVLRSQFMYFFFRSIYPSWIHVSALHIVLLTICLLFSVFMPQIGNIIRFSGAVCGLVYMITLPCLVKIQMIRQNNQAFLANDQLAPIPFLNLKRKEKFKIYFHIFLILCGILNFFGQFVPFFITSSTNQE